MLAAASLAVFLLCAADAWKIERHWLQPHSVYTAAERFDLQDPDQVPFLRDLARYPTLESTWRLWLRPVASGYGYWRPLLMWGFWAESHIVGPSNYAGFIAFLVASHLLFLIVFTLAIQRISGSWSIALVAVLFFSGIRSCPPMSWANSFLFGDPLWSTGPAGDVALDYWKDQADMWFGASFLVALLAIMRRRWTLGITAFAVAVMVKESGWLIAPMALIVLLIDHSLRDVPARAWIGFVAVAALLALGKAHVGVNLTHAGNFTYLAGAPSRYFHLVGGRGLIALTSVSWHAALAGAGLGLLLALSIRNKVNVWKGLSVWIAVVAVSLVIWSHTERIGYLFAWLSLVVPECYLPFLIAECVYAFAAATVLCDKATWRPLAILIAASLLTGLPTIANPWETRHIGYVPGSFQAAIVAFVWVWMARQAWKLILARAKALGAQRLRGSGITY